MADESVPVTLRHIARVRQLLGEFAIEMIKRGDRHDASKFDPIEQGPLDEMQRLIEREGPSPYGSVEYERRTAMLGPMIKHHHERNSHHPEHYPHGVDDMDLFDLVEMFFDWKAASERGKEPAVHLTHSFERYGISLQLGNILINTAKRLGYKFK
jgi:hypothetical protein